ncbi:MAG: hypothetical protein JRN68_07090 [Nitrososphaerota archaeon]|jgi:archaellum biogenesis protein FlaJ (TadC family)|nr:hypothetical protein [Nitrososphaerota archaeon]
MKVLKILSILQIICSAVVMLLILAVAVSFKVPPALYLLFSIGVFIFSIAGYMVRDSEKKNQT